MKTSRHHSLVFDVNYFLQLRIAHSPILHVKLTIWLQESTAIAEAVLLRTNWTHTLIVFISKLSLQCQKQNNNYSSYHA